MREVPKLCRRCEKCEVCESGMECGYHHINKRKFRKEFPRNPLTGKDLPNVIRCGKCGRCLTLGNSHITEKQMRRLQLRDYYRSIGKPNKRITERMLSKSFRKLVEHRRKEIVPFYSCEKYEQDYERYPDERPGWWCEADFCPEYPQDIPEYRRRFPIEN